MKKVWTVWLILCLILTLTACTEEETGPAYINPIYTDKDNGSKDTTPTTEQEFNIVKGNEALISTVFCFDWSTYRTDFPAIVVTDMHGNFTSLNDAAYLRDTVQPTAPILCAGDSINIRAKQDGVMVEDAVNFMEKAIQHKVYFTLGQHEVGIFTTVEGRKKANNMTPDEVYNFYIEPMIDVWDLCEAEKSRLRSTKTAYYYKDFVNTRNNAGARLISLCQYEMPLTEDETDNSCYKYSRGSKWISQTQLNWLVDTLATTPDGYRVIILQHELEANSVSGGEKHDFSYPVREIWENLDYQPAPTSVLNGLPVFEIVQAYIDKTTLSKTYAPIKTDLYPSDTFTVSVDADFTNAKGEFANYILGDGHTDYVGYCANSKQRQIMVTASNQCYDCFVNPSANDASRSIVTLFGYDYKYNCVRLGRVGQQYAMTGQIRVLERVSLSSKE